MRSQIIANFGVWAALGWFGDFLNQFFWVVICSRQILSVVVRGVTFSGLEKDCVV